MHSYCMKLFHYKNLLCLRKECLHIPTLFFYFIFSAPAFLVPATVSCARIPGVFIENRMCLININTFFFIQFEICGRFDFHFEDVLTWDRFDWGRLRTIWPGIDLTGNRKKSLCVKSYLLTIVQLKELNWWLVLNPSFPFKSDIHVT